MTSFIDPADLVKKGLNSLNIPAKPRSLYDPVRYTLGLGGKRLRPQLVIIGCGLCDGDPEKSVPAAMAVELLHNFTLIHDDIMDKADSRRGEPAVHTKWNESTAILSGDVMFTLACEQLSAYSPANGFSGDTFADLHRTFTDAARIVCEGQAIDLDFETSLDVSLDEYLGMIGAKTAALLEASLKMGGITAGADAGQLRELGILGREAGLAFQIQDDLLDAVGDPEKFGKRKGGDIYEGKKTWLTILAVERADHQQKQKLVAVLQNPSCTAEEVAEVIDIFHELDVIRDTREAIKNRYITCLQALDTFPDSPWKNAVVSLIDKLKIRES